MGKYLSNNNSNLKYLLYVVQHLTFGPPPAAKLHHEYSDLACTVELVSSVSDAVDHIHKYGSGHTDVIVTENAATAASFMDSVDSACVFANCSSRMADGYRMGLGETITRNITLKYIRYWQNV